MRELAGKRVMVVGLGVTGRSLARYLTTRGARLALTDRRSDLDRSDLPGDAEIRLGPEDRAWLGGVDLVVASPGIPRDSLLLREAVAARIPVASEIELASDALAGPIVAITGTNGKSTVTVLIGEILKRAGMRPFVGGNLGTPLIDAVGGAHDVAVVEVSSYQLEWIEKFRPFIAIHLNLSDDHFDRYRGLDDYGAAKARIFENQDANDWAILNRDDPNIWKLRERIKARVVSFGMNATSLTPAIHHDGARLLFDNGRERMAIDSNALRLSGRHNLSNAMAAAAAALLLGVAPSVIERTFADFKGLPHRVEFVRQRDGVAYVDDSKGTNVGAVVEALAAVSAPVILIAGGLDKGGDYAPLRAPFKEKVKSAILIGAAREQMRAALAGAAPITCVEKLADAVRHAATIAAAGDTVLLSPACSSFDQFKDYAERGRIFQELVRAL